jgi:predicted dehydrogenase
MTLPESKSSEDPRQASEPFAAGLTVVVIGARRVRQGTGPFLALQAASAGATVAGVLGTRPDSVREAVTFLMERGLQPMPYTDHEEMLTELHPDVVIIASPLGTHRAWLLAALEAGTHVYCEKPLTTAPPAASERIVRNFAAHNLVIAENCQWPQVLPAFRQLHPNVDLSKVTRFRMLLAPPMRGLARWGEVLSHPLSLLQAVAPGPADLHDIHFQEHAPDAVDARLRFTYRTLDRAFDCEIMLEDLQVYPRPAEFAFDDALCRRQVRESDYRMEFVDGKEGCVPQTVGDPMENAVHDFLRKVVEASQAVKAPLDEDLVRRQFLLEDLLEAYRGFARS